MKDLELDHRSLQATDVKNVLAYMQPALFIAAAVGVLSQSCAPLSRAETPGFVNLQIPVPGWTQRNSTHVLKATAKSAIVAHAAMADGAIDIQVVEIEGDGFRYVGKNGRGITGVGGSMLRESARSPDGRLWILAEHSRFPYGIRGNQFCLYVLEDDTWDLVGPRFGAAEDGAWSCEQHGPYFFSDSHPLALSIHPDLNRVHPSWQIRLRQLRAGRWTNLSGFEFLANSERMARFVWREKDAWLFDINHAMERTRLAVRHIRGPRAEDMSRPFRLDSWEGGVRLIHFAVSPTGSIAVHGGNDDDEGVLTEEFIKVYTPVEGGTFRAKDVRRRTSCDDGIRVLAWSPDGTLYVVAESRQKLAVDRYAEGAWRTVAEANQPVEGGTSLIEPRLYFRDDSQPIVTWERFTVID